MEAKAPSPQTSLLILLGASAWPLYPDFQGSEAFANAVRRLKAYFLNPRPFGLPAENLLDLFDSEKGADELDVEMSQFLERRLIDMKKAGNPARDVLLYFVGHGGFVGHDADFYLAIRRTRIGNPRASGLQMMALADMLTERARFLRRIIILDCCFAAAAFSAFEAGPDQVAIEKAVDAFRVGYKTVGVPAKGTTLLCSSSHKSPSLLLPDGSSTMFTKAFLDALVQGASLPRDLTLRDVKDLAADLLSETRNAPRPVVLSPDQSEGDVADMPFFPNPRATERATHAPLPISTAEPRSGIHRTPHLLKGRQARQIILLVVLALLVIGGGSGAGFFILRNNQIASDHAHATATAQAAISARLTATAQAHATADAIGLHNPYSGKLALDDPMKDNAKGSQWEEKNSNDGSCQFSSGAYHVRAMNGLVYFCLALSLDFSNFTFQVQMTILKGSSGGIVFRNDDAQSGIYYLQISSPGDYSLIRFKGDSTIYLKRGSSTFIKTGTSQSNTIAIVAYNDFFYIYINGKYTASAMNSDFSHGQIGVAAESSYNSASEVAFMDAKVWTF